jgi:predicted GNAT family acetyltransferase
VNVIDNREANRFELAIDGQTAFLAYERTPDALRLIHTEVPEAFRGRGLGEMLVKAALDAGRAEGRSIVAMCPFVRAYLRRHPFTDHRDPTSR